VLHVGVWNSTITVVVEKSRKFFFKKIFSYKTNKKHNKNLEKEHTNSKTPKNNQINKKNRIKKNRAQSTFLCFFREKIIIIEFFLLNGTI
jgi:hypothetical protein